MNEIVLSTGRRVVWKVIKGGLDIVYSKGLSSGVLMANTPTEEERREVTAAINAALPNVNVQEN